MPVVNIRRGFDQVEDLLPIVDKFGGAVAGGFARWAASPCPDPAPASDIDIWTPNQAAFDNIVDGIGKGRFVINDTEFAMTLKSYLSKLPVQVLRPIVGQETIYKRLATHDFTVTKARFIKDDSRLEGWAIDTDQNFYNNERDKQIVIDHVYNPIGTFQRVNKYVTKGYTIHPAEIKKILDAYKNMTFEQIGKSLAQLNLSYLGDHL